MSYKSVKEILNDVFDSSDSVLKGIYKTEGEILNIVTDETGDPALKVRIQGLSDGFYTKTQTDALLSAKLAKTAISQAVGNITAPLTHLPLKKNLLTTQGQSICTFTRASTATYTDRYGVLRASANDTPRFTADGILLEGASTNLLIYSEQFDNAAWTKTRSSVSANITAVTDPYGTNLADKLIEDTSSNSHRIGQVASLVAGTTYTFSIFAKPAERSQVRLFADALAIGARFDVLAGTVLSADSGISAKIKPYANGWFRCSITYTPSVSGAVSHDMYSMVSGSIVYTGDGTSGLYIFGAQLEAMPFATSYIPTTATAATRAYNNFSLPQAENTPLYTGDFSIFADVTPSGVLSTQYLIGDANLASGIKFYIDETGDIKFFLNGITIGASTTVSVSDTYRVCIIKQGMSIQIYLNGELRNSNNLPAVPANQTNLYIGSRNGTSGHYFGQINNLRIYDRALTAEEVYAA
ncbi:LamG domain-containing protein [Seleniivibrio woodruffii]|uniref:LamG domain-containing protein n=1 Tax=Seleniivibrio woodruffii TaxID=1078050 RepID=UPI0026F1C931|nr:LamG domain-containing protein [Seleniivibrio woodruffii]